MEQEKEYYNTMFDRLLSKYSKVWIWSIITGINSALTYTYSNYRPGSWNMYGLLIAVFYAFSFMSCLMAWVSLSRVLRMNLLPAIYEAEFDRLNAERKEQLNRGDYSNSSKASSPEDEIARIHYHVKRNFAGARSLESSFKFVIIAICFRFMATIVEFIFNAYLR